MSIFLIRLWNKFNKLVIYEFKTTYYNINN